MTFHCERLGISVQLPQGWHGPDACCDKGPNCTRVDVFPPEEDSNYKAWNPDDGVCNIIIIRREHVNYGAAMFPAGFAYRDGVWKSAYTIKGPLNPVTEIDGPNWHGTVGQYFLHKQYHMDTGGTGLKHVSALVIPVQEMDTIIIRIYSPSEAQGQKMLSLVQKSLTISAKS
jgi:hypothetical protein